MGVIMLKDRIMTDMKNAMRSRDKERLEAIRLLRAAIQRREVDERIDLNDDDVQKVIKKMIKQINKAIVQFEKGKSVGEITVIISASKYFASKFVFNQEE